MLSRGIVFRISLGFDVKSRADGIFESSTLRRANTHRSTLSNDIQLAADRSCSDPGTAPLHKYAFLTNCLSMALS